MNLTEKQLILACRRGQKAAQFELVRRYSGMLMTVCRRYTPDHEMAKDILQESLIKIFEHIDNYKAIGSFEAWMRKITARCALGWISLKLNRQFSSVHELHDDSKVTTGEILENLACEDIIALVQNLPVGFRTVFNLYSIEGYSHKEISKMLDISESASRSQLSRARTILKKKIENSESINHRSA